MTSKFGLLVGNRKHSSHVKEQKVEQRDKRHDRKLERGMKDGLWSFEKTTQIYRLLNHRGRSRNSVYRPLYFSTDLNVFILYRSLCLANKPCEEAVEGTGIV